MGGFKVQGRGEEQAEKVYQDAIALEQAGAFTVVLEGIPEELGERITQNLTIPTIGIGAGRYTDGQVLVIYDLLGLDTSFKPRFVRRYAEVGKMVIDAAQAYCDDVRGSVFPSAEEVFRKTG
jgi:3-methyl-2-oxobutanoate hydroxymethyltransferase